jgi:hypothetical protein
VRPWRISMALRYQCGVAVSVKRCGHQPGEERTRLWRTGTMMVVLRPRGGHGELDSLATHLRKRITTDCAT